MSYELKKIKVLGYTTDFQQCECCGKENLAGTVSILDLDHDVVLHFGTTCAAKADKYDTFDAYRAAKKEINKAINVDKDRKDFATRTALAILKQEYGAGKWSECCFDQLRAEVLINLRDEVNSCNKYGHRKKILGEGQEIPQQFRRDLEATGDVLRVPIPAQWTGINKHKGYK